MEDNELKVNEPAVNEPACGAAAAVQAWLDTPEADYNEGLGLLSRHCRNRVLVQHLMKKQSQANRDKLAYELGKLLAEPALLEAASQTKVAVLPQPDERLGQVAGAAGIGRTAAATLVARLAADNVALSENEAISLMQSRLYAERAKLSNRLAGTGESNEPQAVADRLLIVGRITAIEQEYNQLAEQKERLGKPAESRPEPAAGQAEEQAEAKAEGYGHGDGVAGQQAEEQAEAKARLDSLKLSRTRLAPNLTKARKACEADAGSMVKAEKLARLEAEMAHIDEQIKLQA